MKMKRSPSAIAIEHLERGGWTVANVEKNLTKVIKKDLFGIIDLLAVHPHFGVTLGVQVTSKHNLRARISKVRDAADVLKTLCACGWQVEVWGVHETSLEITRHHIIG
jgi:hypothetical protein